jgi:serine/threonine protein kinase
MMAVKIFHQRGRHRLNLYHLQYYLTITDQPITRPSHFLTQANSGGHQHDESGPPTNLLTFASVSVSHAPSEAMQTTAPQSIGQVPLLGPIHPGTTDLTSGYDPIQQLQAWRSMNATTSQTHNVAGPFRAKSVLEQVSFNSQKAQQQQQQPLLQPNQRAATVNLTAATISVDRRQDGVYQHPPLPSYAPTTTNTINITAMEATVPAPAAEQQQQTDICRRTRRRRPGARRSLQSSFDKAADLEQQQQQQQQQQQRDTTSSLVSSLDATWGLGNPNAIDTSFNNNYNRGDNKMLMVEGDMLLEKPDTPPGVDMLALNNKSVSPESHVPPYHPPSSSSGAYMMVVPEGREGSLPVHGGGTAGKTTTTSITSNNDTVCPSSHLDHHHHHHHHHHQQQQQQQQQQQHLISLHTEEEYIISLDQFYETDRFQRMTVPEVKAIILSIASQLVELHVVGRAHGAICPRTVELKIKKDTISTRLSPPLHPSSSSGICTTNGTTAIVGTTTTTTTGTATHGGMIDHQMLLAATATATADQIKAVQGCPFMAPEVSCCRKSRGTATPASDMWSLGVLLFQLLSGVQLPFGTQGLSVNTIPSNQQHGASTSGSNRRYSRHSSRHSIISNAIISSNITNHNNNTGNNIVGDPTNLLGSGNGNGKGIGCTVDTLQDWLTSYLEDRFDQLNKQAAAQIDMMLMEDAGIILTDPQVLGFDNDGAKLLQGSLLTADPAQRVSVRKLLRHPWLRQGVVIRNHQRPKEYNNNNDASPTQRQLLASHSSKSPSPDSMLSSGDEMLMHDLQHDHDDVRPSSSLQGVVALEDAALQWGTKMQHQQQGANMDKVINMTATMGFMAAAAAAAAVPASASATSASASAVQNTMMNTNGRLIKQMLTPAALQGCNATTAYAGGDLMKRNSSQSSIDSVDTSKLTSIDSGGPLDFKTAPEGFIPAPAEQPPPGLLLPPGAAQVAPPHDAVVVGYLLNFHSLLCSNRPVEVQAMHAVVKWNGRHYVAKAPAKVSNTDMRSRAFEAIKLTEMDQS